MRGRPRALWLTVVCSAALTACLPFCGSTDSTLTVRVDVDNRRAGTLSPRNVTVTVRATDYGDAVGGGRYESWTESFPGSTLGTEVRFDQPYYPLEASAEVTGVPLGYTIEVGGDCTPLSPRASDLNLAERHAATSDRVLSDLLRVDRTADAADWNCNFVLTYVGAGGSTTATTADAAASPLAVDGSSAAPASGQQTGAQATASLPAPMPASVAAPTATATAAAAPAATASAAPASTTSPTATATATAIPSPEPTETPSATATAPPTEIPSVLSGAWTLTVKVTKTSGVCVGEENDPAFEETIEIVQTGGAVVVTGGSDAIKEPWTGTFDGTTLIIVGERKSGSGITKLTYTLDYNPIIDTLLGAESWSWSGGSGTCPNGLSSITGRRS